MFGLSVVVLIPRRFYHATILLTPQSLVSYKMSLKERVILTQDEPESGKVKVDPIVKTIFGFQ